MLFHSDHIGVQKLFNHVKCFAGYVSAVQFHIKDL